MKSEDLFKLLGNIDDELIEDIDFKKKKRKRTWPRIFVAALVFGVLVSGAYLKFKDLGQSQLAEDEKQDQNIASRENLPILAINPDIEGAFGFGAYMAYDVEEIEKNPYRDLFSDFEKLPVYENISFVEDSTGLSKYDRLLVDQSIEHMKNIASLYKADLKDEDIILNLVNCEDSSGSYDPIEISYKYLKTKASDENFDYIENISSQIRDFRFMAYGGDKIRVDFNESSSINLNQALGLSEVYRSKDKLGKVGEYLISDYPHLINLEDPKINIRGGGRDIDGEQVYRLEIYEGSEDLVQGFKNSQLGPKISVYLDYDDNINSIHYDFSDESSKIASYPIISKDQAINMLKEGTYMTSVPYEFPGSDYIKRIDLLYINDSSQKYLLPYYEFYVGLEEEYDPENSLKTYGLYYVPAIEPMYVENIPTYDGESD